ncbi:MAG: hypothetical protein L3J39_06965 [Verrucomicrobiales bacterium]|nr:hypothetical protein [Verrucomicrobiales bacterium]
MKKSLLSEIDERLAGDAILEDPEIRVWAEEIDRLDIPWFALFRFEPYALHFELPLFSEWVPYCFPEAIPLDARSLKTCMAYLLENYEYILGLPTDCPWAGEFQSAIRLKIECDPPVNFVAKEGHFPHQFNLAIQAHFFSDGDNRNALNQYQKGFDLSGNNDQRALISCYCALLHCDLGKPDEALALCHAVLALELDETCEAYLKAAAVEAFAQASATKENWDEESSYFFSLIKEALAFFKDHHDRIRYAELLQNSAAIARKKGDFSEAIAYLSVAHNVFEEREMTDSIAHVHLAKAGILSQWGEQNPAFYDQALKHFDHSLETFTPEEYPLLYSDIQLQIAFLYAEKPGEKSQQLMWRSFSIQSFKNALKTTESAPVQHARVAHNYASAIAKFGLELGRNENPRALELIRSALEVRIGEGFSLERAFSLLTLIEIHWSSLEMGEGNKSDILDEITQAIAEIESLTAQPEVLAELKAHKQLLGKGKKEVPAHA